MKKIIIIGAGPAGMMAAIEASKNNNVFLLDGNDKLGKKLFITGKGRCNVTNAKNIGDFFDYIKGNPEFLYSSLYSFTNEDTMKFFESRGIKLKVERGDRVFPYSDKSSDIIKGLKEALKENNVNILFNHKVTDINIKDDKIISVVCNDKIIEGDHFIIATGGASYESTGSRGEGQILAQKMGHNIIPLKPSLVPIELKEKYVKDLMGLSLKNVKLKILENKKVVYSEQGEMLFTHFGISGPLVLSGSRYIKEDKNYKVSIDLKPALDFKALDNRILKDFKKYSNKEFKNSLQDLLPKKIIDTVVMLSNIPADKRVNEITKEERKNLVLILKDLSFDVLRLRSLNEAIVTKGGIDTSEIDPSTMKSKIISNLSFAGEVIDVDAFTGGYNVQIALSTGYVAGSSI